MVLDDDEDIASIVAQILEMNGYQCEYQTDHREFLKKLDNENPDLLIIDVRLKEADGRDICKKIKADKDIPVVLFSANTDVTHNLKDYNADGFIAKPFEIDYFIEAIKKMTA